MRFSEFGESDEKRPEYRLPEAYLEAAEQEEAAQLDLADGPSAMEIGRDMANLGAEPPGLPILPPDEPPPGYRETAQSDGDEVEASVEVLRLHGRDASDSDARGEWRSDDGPSDSQGPGSDGDSSYDREAAAQRDGDLLIESIDELSNDLDELADRLEEKSESQVVQAPELDEETSKVRQIMERVQLLRVIVHGLLAEGVGQSPDLAFTATTQMQATSGEVKRSRKRFGKENWDNIWATVKRASGWLWSLVSHLVKVKEWTVTGQIGLGPIGLAQGSISVTFGE
jgi:hypothetical protein